MYFYFAMTQIHKIMWIFYEKLHLLLKYICRFFESEFCLFWMNGFCLKKIWKEIRRKILFGYSKSLKIEDK